MLTVYNTLLDFDITCPEDLMRYNSAIAHLNEHKKKTKNAGTTHDENSMNSYVEFLRQECDVVINFIDEVFGEGTCNKLLGEKSSLSSLIDLCDEIAIAVKSSAKCTEKKFARYEPNRKKGDGCEKKAVRRKNARK